MWLDTGRTHILHETECFGPTPSLPRSGQCAAGQPASPQAIATRQGRDWTPALTIAARAGWLGTKRTARDRLLIRHRVAR